MGDGKYMADYRRRNPDYVRRQKKLEAARNEARRTLSERYETEYEAILAEIRKREGL